MHVDKNKWLLFIIALYFIFAVNYSINVPAFEAPDEPDHFNHVKYLLKYHNLPLLNGNINGSPRTAIHPPLYYFLGALIYSPVQKYGHQINVTYNEKFGLINKNRYFHKNENIIDHYPFYIIRLFSVFLGMGTIIFGWKTAKECFGDNYYLVILSTALIAFVPQFIYISASINCDNLANLISTVIIWLLVKAAKKEILPERDIYLIGIFLGLAMITKFTALFLIPLAIIVLYIIKNNKNEFIKNILVLSIIICLVAGWYYLRNYIFYDSVLGGKFVIKRSLFSSYFIKPFGNIMPLSFIGLFGWMNILMNKYIYIIYCLLYGIGFSAALTYLIKDTSLKNKYPRKNICNWILLLSIIISLLSIIRYNMAYDDYQGRHMHTIIAPFAVLVIQGYNYIYSCIKGKYNTCLGNRLKTLIAFIVIIILASLNLFIVNAYIKPSYFGAFI